MTTTAGGWETGNRHREERVLLHLLFREHLGSHVAYPVTRLMKQNPYFSHELTQVVLDEKIVQSKAQQGKQNSPKQRGRLEENITQSKVVCA